VGAGTGATSLWLALLGTASSTGSWCAAVTVPSMGAAAAAEYGMDLGRLAVLPEVPAAQWSTVVGALLDAMDMVVVGPPVHLRAGEARRLVQRARERGAVLVVVAPGAAWQDGVDLRLRVTAAQWEGLGQGHGHLQARRVEVVAVGRGAATQERRAVLWLPAASGGVAGVTGVAGVAAAERPTDGEVALATSTAQVG
jgi:hypothetical protein